MSAPVSVIIPTFNRQSFLRTAIDSVLDQNYPGLECIVVDDGSEDATGELLREYGDRIVVVRQANQGPAAARNTGIRAARHELIAFLDSDDRFAKGKLAAQAAAMAAFPDYLVSHTEEIWYRRGKFLNPKKKHRKHGGDIFSQSLELCAVSISTAMARRELFHRVGFFDPDLPCCEDYDFWLRVSCRLPFLLVDEALTIKDGGRPDQLTVRYRMGMDRFRIQALRKLLASEDLTPEQGGLARRELANKCRIYGNGCRKHGRPEGDAYLALARTIEQGDFRAGQDWCFAAQYASVK